MFRIASIECIFMYNNSLQLEFRNVKMIVGFHDFLGSSVWSSNYFLAAGIFLGRLVIPSGYCNA